MPCYNSQDYCEQAIKSVVNQTYSKWEFIIVNDGSTDKTLDILNRYHNDHRIKIFNKSNGGYCSALNFGLDKIDGDYFLFLGSDDYLCLDLFEKSCKLMKDKLPDIAIFKSVFHNINGKFFSDTHSDFKKIIYENKSSFNNFVNLHPNDSTLLYFRDTSKFFKKSLLKDLRYFGRTGYFSDSIFSLLFSYKCCSFMILPIEGYHIIQRKTAISYGSPSVSICSDILTVSHLFLFNILNNINLVTPLLFCEIKYICYFLNSIGTIRNNDFRLFVKKFKLIKSLSKMCIQAIKKYKIQDYITKKRLCILRFPILWFFVRTTKKN